MTSALNKLKMGTSLCFATVKKKMYNKDRYENVCLTLLPKNAHGITQRPTEQSLHRMKEYAEKAHKTCLDPPPPPPPPEKSQKYRVSYKYWSGSPVKVSKGAEIRNRYNQVPHLQ